MDGTLTGASTLGQSEPSSNGHKENDIIIPIAPELESHQQMQFSVIYRILLGVGSYPFIEHVVGVF